MATKIIVAAIEHDAKKLHSLVLRINTTSAKYHVELQSAAISTLLHAAKNGRVEDLQLLYNGMKEAYRSAFRQYVQKNCGQMITNKDGSKSWDGYLSFSKDKGFAIQSKRQPARDRFIANADTLVEGKPFFESDPALSPPVFVLTDEAVLTRLDRLIKDAQKPESKVSTELLNRLLLARKSSEAIVHPVVPETPKEQEITKEIIAEHVAKQAAAATPITEGKRRSAKAQKAA